MSRVEICFRTGSITNVLVSGRVKAALDLASSLSYGSPVLVIVLLERAMSLAIWKATRLFGNHLSRVVRKTVHHLKGETLNVRLPASGCQAVIEPLVSRRCILRSTRFEAAVRVTNRGDCTWSSYGSHPVHLQIRWLAKDGTPLAVPVTSVPLPTALRPGESVVVRELIRAIPSLGTYRLRFDVCQESAGSFARFDSRTAEQEVIVDAPTLEDIDYHKHFASFDLNKDYWTVVGPTTKELYDRLAQLKLQHMIDLGLTPDSRVLDVGCGTGQLAGALVNYLSDRGSYYGVELAQAGVDFCRKRFPQKNFRFARNEMTSLPIQNVQFDMIVYFSVFTHTYPHETAALLKESRRLLAPNGLIFADLFKSPMVEGHVGNRGALELGEEAVERIFSESRLQATEVCSSPWGEYGKRCFYRLTASES